MLPTVSFEYDVSSAAVVSSTSGFGGGGVTTRRLLRFRRASVTVSLIGMMHFGRDY